jgi:hypothetical protein
MLKARLTCFSALALLVGAVPENTVILHNLPSTFYLLRIDLQRKVRIKVLVRRAIPGWVTYLIGSGGTGLGIEGSTTG